MLRRLAIVRPGGVKRESCGKRDEVAPATDVFDPVDKHPQSLHAFQLGREGQIDHDEPTRGYISPGCHSTVATAGRTLFHDQAW